MGPPVSSMNSFMVADQKSIKRDLQGYAGEIVCNDPALVHEFNQSCGRSFRQNSRSSRAESDYELNRN